MQVKGRLQIHMTAQKSVGLIQHIVAGHQPDRLLRQFLPKRRNPFMGGIVTVEKCDPEGGIHEAASHPIPSLSYRCSSWRMADG